MTDKILSIQKLSEIIFSRLTAGFRTDEDSRHFLHSACGVNDDGEVLNYLNDPALNDGTIYELTVFPDDSFRFEIEKELPPCGIFNDGIELLRSSLIEKKPAVSIITDSGVHCLDAESSLSCVSSFVRKLNLDADMSFLDGPGDYRSEEIFYKTRSLLRKRKFTPTHDRGNFIKGLLRYEPDVKNGDPEILMLIDRGISLLAGTGGKAFDSLASKKYYYESVISQTEEFAALLKNWGMEFLMMKRIQPPSVSVDESVETIRIIDRLTSIVYGVIIPPSDIAVQLRINRDDAVSDIFR